MFENFPTTQIDNLNLFKVTKSNLKPLLVQNIQKLQNVFVLNTFHILHQCSLFLNNKSLSIL